MIIEGQEYLSQRFPLSWGIDQRGVLQRAAYAKDLGMIEQAIPLIGFFLSEENYHPGKVLTIEKIEQWLQVYRREYPEMPGIAFYGGDGEELLRQAEALCWQYYVEPAPEVRFVEPAFAANLRHPRVQLRVEAAGKEGRMIQRYDWFVDNRMVAQTSEDNWVWDTRDVEKGYHLLTVHAIDEDWNRASVQIKVLVER